jgi:hypothetical protein
VPEAARLLRPDGRLVFHITTALAAMCTARDSEQAGHVLVRLQRDVARVESAGRGVEFHPSHGQWISILRTAGFALAGRRAMGRPPGGAWGVPIMVIW